MLGLVLSVLAYEDGAALRAAEELGTIVAAVLEAGVRITPGAVIKRLRAPSPGNRQPEGQAAIPDQKAVPFSRNSP